MTEKIEEKKVEKKKPKKKLTIDEQLAILDKEEQKNLENIKVCQEKKKVLLSQKTNSYTPIHVLLQEQKLVNENIRKQKQLEALKIIDFINTKG